MPIASFFATKADLMPGLAALQKERPLQFVRCRAGGGLESAEIPSFSSLADAADLDHLQSRSWPGREIDRSDLLVFLVLDAHANIAIEELPTAIALPEGGTLRYRIVPSATTVPCVTLIPGGLEASRRALWCGELQAGYTHSGELHLYRQMVETLFVGFKQWGGYFYGPEALALGRSGIRYAYTLRLPYKPWTYDALAQSEQQAVPLPAKPEHGRLSLEQSWDWLEACGYEMPRKKDGTPRPYRRRPGVDSSPERGVGLFRTSIDEEELDHLTIPYTYIGKSFAYGTTFLQSDLSQSRFAANQFALCDFAEANLSGAYMADFFLECSFKDTELTGADLRWSTFNNCTFAGAKMTGAKLLKKQAQEVALSEEQNAEIAWRTTAGPEPAEL